MPEEELSPTTRILRTRCEIEGADPVVTPLFQTSAFEASSPHFYTRKENPNGLEIEEVIAGLERSTHCLSVTTGMTALLVVLGLVPTGGTLVINTLIYGCTYRLCFREAKKRNLKLVVLDLSAGDESLSKIPEDAHMILFETPTNPFLRTINISSLARWRDKHAPGMLMVVDNTWATPLFQRPLECGADISLYSATKFFGGHSDVMGGFITTDRDDLHEEMSAERFYGGMILAPHSAWLIRRSMQTFSLRMREHERVTTEMHKFLESLSCIQSVYAPEVDGTQLTGYGCILFIEIGDELGQRYQLFRDALTLFSSGTGMACVTSMVAQPCTGSHASLTEDEKAAMGIGKGLIRLCFGFEDPNDLKRDLTNAFRALQS